MMISLIVAASENNVIGKDGQIPWHLPKDLKMFKRLTTGHHLIVGRKTYQSIGKPLPQRSMVVLSRQTDFQAPGCQTAENLVQALKIARAAGDDEIFIGGGAAVYQIALPMADRIYFTRVHTTLEGDTFFPLYDMDGWAVELEQFFPAGENQKFDFTFSILKRK